MKEEIQPTYYPEAVVTCACGNTWKTGSTQELIKTDICSACHPFFTGEQRIVDTEGQVDRFYKKIKSYEDNSLVDAKLVTVADLLVLLEGGDQTLLDIKGFGRKSLIDLKKALRAANFEIPEAAEEITV